MSASAISANESVLELGSFRVDGRTFGIDIAQVREVVRWQDATPLPNSPDLIDGVIDLRGSIIPVVDLGRALGLSRVKGGSAARIVVAEIEGLIVGLSVDGADRVLPTPVSLLEDPPALVTQAGYGIARGVVRRADGMPPILVLSLENLLERIYRSALDDTETPS